MIDESSSCTLTAGLLLAGGVLPCAWGLRPLLPRFPMRLARTGGSLEPSLEPEEPPEAAASAALHVISPPYCSPTTPQRKEVIHMPHLILQNERKKMEGESIWQGNWPSYLIQWDETRRHGLIRLRVWLMRTVWNTAERETNHVCPI